MDECDAGSVERILPPDRIQKNVEVDVNRHDGIPQSQSLGELTYQLGESVDYLVKSATCCDNHLFGIGTNTAPGASRDRIMHETQSTYHSCSTPES